jgi:hypothetical protein
MNTEKYIVRLSKEERHELQTIVKKFVSVHGVWAVKWKNWYW